MNAKSAPKVTIHTLRKMKETGERIAMLTAYDATFARLLDQAGVDILLVGDSLGMVVQGSDNTLPVTMEEMIYHCRAVARGARARAGGRRHAVHVVPGLARGGHAQRRPPGEGGRRRGGQARGRRRVRRAGARGCRASASRSWATSASRRSRCTRWAASRCRAATTRAAQEDPRRRARARGGRLLRDRARGHPARAGARRSPRRSPSRPSASAPASTATARCWWSTTCSA